MKHIKKLSALLMCALIALSACITASAATNQAIKPTASVNDPYKLIINLYESANQAIQDLPDKSGLTHGNGVTPPTTSFDKSNFANVKFNIYNANATRDGKTGNVIGTAITTNGVATYTTTTAGTYWVELDESTLPKEVAAVLDLKKGFAVDLPMTNAAGTGWLKTVNVYPKVDTVWGIAKFKKIEKVTNAVLSGATFALYRTDITQDMINAAATSYDQLKAALSASGITWTAYGSTLTSKSDGTFDTGTIPYGAYKLVETMPPKDHALDTTPYYFIIDGLQATHNIGNFTTSGDTNIIGEVKIINEKLEGISKTLKTPSDGTASIGDEVTWEIRGKVPSDAGKANYTKFVFTDNLDNAFSHKSTTVTVGGAEVTNVAAYDQSTKIVTVNLKDKINLTNANKDIVITIKATLNADVRLLSTGIQNTATLTYNNGGGDVVKDATSKAVKTGGYTFKKVDSADNNKVLKDAKFKVYKSNGTQVTDFRTNAGLTTTPATGGIVTSDGDGLVHIYGLAYGSYYLEEVQAPKGYELNGGHIDFAITEATSASGVDKTIYNKKKVELPFTGGVGAEVVVASGVLMMVAAGFVLKKRVK